MPTLEVRSVVKKEIREIRDNRKKTERARNHEVAKLIAYDLQQFGAFYHEKQGRAFYFEYSSKKLFDLNSDAIDGRIFLRRYGINHADKMYNYVMAELTENAHIYGQEIEVQQLSYYDAQQAALYVYNEESVERITADDIRTVPNGTDGVIFLPTKGATPWVRGEETDPEVQLTDQYLWNPVTLADDELTAAERRKLLVCWFYAMFFGSIIKIRPILTFVGPKRSGKTFTLQLIGKLLFGDAFDVSPIPADEKEFDLLAASQPFFVIDNADSKCKWFEDRLAIVATGGTRKVRELYTTSSVLEIPMKSWVAITSRSPHFRRDDVADRLLIMQVEPRKNFGQGGNPVLAEMRRNRDAIMTEICYNLQQIVAAQQLSLDNDIDVRMTDFAAFCFKIGKARGLEEWFRSAFKKLFGEQSNLTLEMDPMVDLLRGWIVNHNGQEVSTTQLFDALKAMAESNKIEFWFKNAKSLGLKLANIQANLEEWYVVTKRKDRDKRTLWCFYGTGSCGETASPPALKGGQNEMF